MAAPLDVRRSRRFSIWTVVAPLVLLGAVSVLVVIAQGAGWVGSDSKPKARTRPKPHTSRPSATKPRKHAPPPVVRLRYAVQAGDTFGSIAVRFHTSVEQLQALNPGVDSSRLTIGEQVRVR